SYSAHASSSRFFSTATASSEIYTLSLHDALPIFSFEHGLLGEGAPDASFIGVAGPQGVYGNKGNIKLRFDTTYMQMVSKRSLILDRKSTRLNSSHVKISYAVFCLKKKRNRKVIIS